MTLTLTIQGFYLNWSLYEYTICYVFFHLSPGGTGGGQTVTLTGQGFSEDLTATICGDTCVLKQTTSSEYVCKTPAKSGKLS